MSRSAPSPRTLAPLDLRAGPLSLRFEPETLWLRNLRAGETELIRAVYPTVRDSAWNTALPRVTWVHCRRTARGFSLALRATYGGARPWFTWEIAIDGTASGSIRMEACGTANRTFATNRTGLCVLHPAEVAGEACTIEHTDGHRERTHFPREISPHQPFFDLRALSHRAPRVGRVDVWMEGDTFEMEDQRNWTDASFKTYCRPLALPAPYTLKAGDTVKQSVTVSFAPAARRQARPTRDPLRLGPQRHRLPAVGLRLTAATPGGRAQAHRLSHLPLAHLRLDLDTYAHGSLQGWDNALRDLAAFPPTTGLEVCLHARPGDLGLELLAHAAAVHVQERPLRWIVLDRGTGCTTEALLEEVRRLWSRYRVPGEIGGGVGSDFVRLNRARPIMPGMAFVAFGLDPQVHAFDDASLLETLTVQAKAVTQAKRLSGGLPVVLSPVTLGRPRLPGRSPGGDPRQSTPFAAVWTLGCLATLTASGAAAVTLHGTAGPAGVLPPHAGKSSPLLRLLEAWTGFSAKHATVLAPVAHRSITAVALQGEEGVRVLLANLRPDPTRVRLAGLPDFQPKARALCARGRAPLIVRRQGPDLAVALPGYAVIQLDFPAS